MKNEWFHKYFNVERQEAGGYIEQVTQYQHTDCEVAN
jgi:hypothetical protein